LAAAGEDWVQESISWMFGVLDVALRAAAAPKMAFSEQVSALLGKFLIIGTEIRGWQQVPHEFCPVTSEYGY